MASLDFEHDHEENLNVNDDDTKRSNVNVNVNDDKHYHAFDKHEGVDLDENMLRLLGSLPQVSFVQQMGLF